MYLYYLLLLSIEIQRKERTMHVVAFTHRASYPYPPPSNAASPTSERYENHRERPGWSLGIDQMVPVLG